MHDPAKAELVFQGVSKDYFYKTHLSPLYPLSRKRYMHEQFKNVYLKVSIQSTDVRLRKNGQRSAKTDWREMDTTLTSLTCC